MQGRFPHRVVSIEPKTQFWEWFMRTIQNFTKRSKKKKHLNFSEGLLYKTKLAVAKLIFLFKKIGRREFSTNLSLD